MHLISKESQIYFSTILCYIASWLGIGLGLMWMWFGYISLGRGVARNLIFNPVLIIDGMLVIIFSIMIAFKSKFGVVFISCYAIVMELILQIYNYNHIGNIKLKPYFFVELVGLVVANIGVFWFHKAKKHTK